MATTPPTTVPEPQLFEEDVEMFQGIINIYHDRLMAAWATQFRGEAVPPGGGDTPDITNWAPSKIAQALKNFKNHMYLYSQNSSHAMRYATYYLINSGRRLIGNYSNQNSTPLEWSLDRRATMADLETVEELLGIDSSGKMMPLWIDHGEEKEREMAARRFPKLESS
ncbi:hypothetical protein EDC01DRAFT_635367 [Geopyxis carbonaria]|nr:hypothetical protein EDC01DRAFT_635367 [Geopyxis carbonaria]